ncbi:putative lipid II flippase FtsW [Candidatus Uhrbacteria bacterium]|nr:putative lipid II flippase FtsW [Candidatus Uhrbacteria bacterium]
MTRRRFSLAKFFPYFRGGTPDYLLVGCFILLVLIGLVMLSSASSVVSFQKFDTTYYYITHQLLFGFLPGLLFCYLASRIDYHVWEGLAPIFLVLSIGLLLLVFIPGFGFEAGGAQRWAHIGPIVFQPSEVVKLTFLLYLAAWLTKRKGPEMRDLSYGFLPFVVLVGSVSLLVILQPDMGTMGIIALISAFMYVMSGAPLAHLGLIGLGGVALSYVLLQVAPYRMERLTVFLNPGLDPLGNGYHINQALLAIGSGGIFGRGFGLSRQKYAYLPEVVGDSIFAVIAEELGFILAVGLIALFVFFAMRGLRIARRAPDSFGFLISVGIVSWIIFQAFVNIGAMIAMLPLTGIPLPFVSYGGTALIVSMTAVGILINISRQTS